MNPKLTDQQGQHLKQGEINCRNVVQAKTLMCSQENRFEGGVLPWPHVQQAVSIDFSQFQSSMSRQMLGRLRVT
jgi:hypothetical protein